MENKTREELIKEIDCFYEKAKLVKENFVLFDQSEKRIEDGTRYLVKKYLERTDKILELGARYGSVSIYLDKFLLNPKEQLIAVEPDGTVMEAINVNKKLNDCTFNIYNGTISNGDLYVVYNGCIWETKTYKVPPPGKRYEKCETKKIDELINMYNIIPNVLIADCEGFLLEFMEENIDFIKSLDVIIYEEDCCKSLPINGIYIDYELVNKILIDNGFVLLESFRDHIGLLNKCWKKNK